MDVRVVVVKLVLLLVEVHVLLVAEVLVIGVAQWLVHLVVGLGLRIV